MLLCLSIKEYAKWADISNVKKLGQCFAIRSDEAAHGGSSSFLFSVITWTCDNMHAKTSAEHYSVGVAGV